MKASPEALRNGALCMLFLVLTILFQPPAAAIDSDIPKEYMYLLVAVAALLLLFKFLWEYFRTAYPWLILTGTTIIISVVIVVLVPSAPFLVILPVVGGTTLLANTLRKRKWRHADKEITSHPVEYTPPPRPAHPVVTVHPVHTVVEIPSPPPVNIVIPVIKISRDKENNSFLHHTDIQPEEPHARSPYDTCQ